MDFKKQRIVYMGTPEISAFVLDGLVQAGYQIVGLIAQPDKPIGRNKVLEPVPTKVVAMKYDIPVYQPIKIRLDWSFIHDLAPDLIVCFAYGQIIPQGLLDAPKLGCVNLHGSLLPKYRGAAPMQYALMHGDKVTGVTLMQMIDKMDAGLMYAKKEIPLSEDDSLKTLSEKMAKTALALALETLPNYMNELYKGEAQSEEEVVFSPSITKAQEHIDLTKSAVEVVNYIRALNDTPGAYLLDGENHLKVYRAKVMNQLVEAELGTIVKADKQGLWMQCKDGQIALLELQKEGKRIVDYKSFVNGERDLIGRKLT